MVRIAGTTVLKNQIRLEKDNDYFKAVGDTDELNACLGLAREYCGADMPTLSSQLVEIQSRLLDIGSVRRILLSICSDVSMFSCR